MSDYFGTYADFETISKKDASMLLGASNAVGDVYNIDVVIEGGKHIAWIVSLYGERIGYLNPKLSKRISLAKAQGLVCKAILSFVAYTENPEGGRYWGQVALICFKDDHAQAFENFIKNVSKRISNDVRPNVEFGQEGVEKIIESDGSWMPQKNIPLPINEKGTAYLKRRKRALDTLTEMGRAKNKGCYVASWAFLLLAIAAIAFWIKGCMG